MSVTGTFNVTIADASFQPVDPVALGLSRLPIQFKDKSIINGVLRCLLTPIVQLEQSIARTVVQRNANVATGVTLTNLGRLVGLSRITTIDDDFRRYVRAQIATNKSLARFEDIITVAVLVLGETYGGNIILHNEGAATARLLLTGEAVTDTVANILSTLEFAAVAVGVRLIIEWSNYAPGATFTFNTGPGFNNGHLAASRG